MTIGRWKSRWKLRGRNLRNRNLSFDGAQGIPRPGSPSRILEQFLSRPRLDSAARPRGGVPTRAARVGC